MRPLRRRLLAAGLAGGALGLTGCASPALLVRQPPAGLPRRVELVETPYHPQEDYQCGPAALAMVLGAAGITVAPAELSGQVFLPGRQGSLQIEMLAAARRRGALAMEVPGNPEALLRETAAGNPVVVLLNLGLSWAPTWHYAVVIGYDLDSEVFLLRSGPLERQVLSFRTFGLTWERAGSWGFVALPPERLAATADAAGATRALVAFEKAAPAAAAARAYRTGLARWTDSLVFAIGLGNSLYRAGDLAGAERAFREAAQRHDAPAAWTNLAHVLNEQGRAVEARAAAARARSGGGAAPALP